MLSILIPIFNWDIRLLVAGLKEQGDALCIPYEILCIDDGSTPQFTALNREVVGWSGVVYRELPQNIGRSAIRNLLGRSATFSNLLFLDSDSAIIGSGYLRAYVPYLNKDVVVVGGTVYSEEKPEDPSRFLRWKYGRAREQRSVALRQQAGWGSFMTHHFLIPKACFLGHPFEEKIREYGHEDTLFGQCLARLNVSLQHIDNPLAHIGLEPAPVFLEKVDQSVRNLIGLVQDGILVQTRLTTAKNWMRYLRIAPMLLVCFRLSRGVLYRHLCGANPRLWVLDLYKLGLFLTYENVQRSARPM